MVTLRIDIHIIATKTLTVRQYRRCISLNINEENSKKNSRLSPLLKFVACPFKYAQDYNLCAEQHIPFVLHERFHSSPSRPARAAESVTVGARGAAAAAPRGASGNSRWRSHNE